MKDNKDIPTETILQDIADTKAEIIDANRKIEGYRLIGDRMSHFRADGLAHGIVERNQFIEKLEAILKLRGYSGIPERKD